MIEQTVYGRFGKAKAVAVAISTSESTTIVTSKEILRVSSMTKRTAKDSAFASTPPTQHCFRHSARLRLSMQYTEIEAERIVPKSVEKQGQIHGTFAWFQLVCGWTDGHTLL